MSGGHIRNCGRHFLEEEHDRHVENSRQIEKSVRPDPGPGPAPFELNHDEINLIIALRRIRGL